MRKPVIHNLLSLTIFILLMLFTGTDTAAQFEPEEDTLQEQATDFFDTNPHTNNQVDIRKVPDSTISRIKSEDEFWYADMAPEKKEDKKEEGSGILGSGWFNALVWIIIIISMAGVLIWYLASSDIRLFRKPSVVISDNREESITEDIFAVDYDREIARAVSDRNYRLATRLFYLQTLKELSDKNLIEYKHESTNREYVQQLSSSSYYRDFFRLTRDFEYTWYGKFELSPEAFLQVQDDFNQFKIRITS